MTSLAALKKGLTKTNQSKRIIVFAWCMNIALALIVALPMLHQLDSSIRHTVKEEELLRQVDENWFRTFQFEVQNSEIAKLLDYSIFGAGPFMRHVDGILKGSVVQSLGNFFYDLVTSFTFRFSYFNILTLMALLSMVINSYLAGGFISAYAGDYPVRMGEFFGDGARYFGRFLRIAFVALLFYYFLFSYVLSQVNSFLDFWTSNEPSEWIPFVYYQGKNILLLFLLSLSMMCVDYTRIRLVLEDRYSVFGAFAAGMSFAFRNFIKTYFLYLLICLFGLLFIVLFVFIERLIPQTGFWTILTVFILQQLYMLIRMYVRAVFYASQTVLAQKIS